jgi:nucleoid-associated protein YgaU
MFVGAGCGDRDNATLPAETDESYYVQGKQLMKQNRNPEALTVFLKLIDKRGERGAPESHLEAAYLYLHHTKDPVEAYHHFRKYLKLQPNSKEAVQVKGMADAALREFARTLPTRPLEDQSMRMQSEDVIERLKRENEELRAQNATLRGGGGAPMVRPAPTISLPDELTPGATPPPQTTVASSPPPATTPSSRPATNPGTTTPTPGIQLPTARNSPSNQQRPTTTPTRPGSSGTRTHVVAPKETLYGISTKFYGNPRQMDAIYQANRDVMKSREDLRAGMTLKIPALDAAPATRR